MIIPILGYAKQAYREPPYWFGSVNGEDHKFIRVVAGVSLPIFDRMSGAVIVLGETHRSSSPMNLFMIAASVGSWPSVENQLAQFRKDLKFGDAVLDSEPARGVFFRMRGVKYGYEEIPLISHVAPDYSLSEIGRSYVNELLAEGRLHGNLGIKQELEREKSTASAALQMAVCWMREWPAIYAAPSAPQTQGRILGMEGLI